MLHKKTRRIENLLSREKLLHHIKEDEDNLKKEVKAYKSHSPAYQYAFLERYLEFQDDLSRLKLLHEKKTDQGQQYDVSEDWNEKKTIDELRILCEQFEKFLMQSGF